MSSTAQPLEDKTILITGGTGSLGKVLTRRLLSEELGRPRRVIVLSRDEAKQHFMRLAFMNRAVSTDEVIYDNFKRILEFRLGDIRNYADVCTAVRDAQVIVNAAALKQVPNCEYFPDQAVLTNCIGPMNIVRAVREHGKDVETVVGISTDKACKPVNAMGMSKALHERILTSANVLSPNTRFICVRYGNVMASRGSVIPLFHDQIRNGGPVTLTVPHMTRFLMTLDQAVDTVFNAILYAKPGETYIPCAPSATVEDLAKALIGNRRIPIKVIGIRPGEKLHEILISEEEAPFTVRRGNYYAISSMLPELLHEREGETLTGEYSSADATVSLEETSRLLYKHKMHLGQTDDTPNVELFEKAAA
jgi:FlaA1/EpsC-like NDP-sugar epimerase